MKVASFLIGFSALAMLASPAAAQINRRQANQDARIDRGVANGSLTVREGNRLERQNRASANIYRQKRDCQNRWNAKGRATKGAALVPDNEFD